MKLSSWSFSLSIFASLLICGSAWAAPHWQNDFRVGKITLSGDYNDYSYWVFDSNCNLITTGEYEYAVLPDSNCRKGYVIEYYLEDGLGTMSMCRVNGENPEFETPLVPGIIFEGYHQTDPDELCDVGS